MVKLLTLAEHVDQLLAFCGRVAGPVPQWKRQLLLDTTDKRVRWKTGVDHGWQAPRDALVPIDQCSERFDSLLRAGYSWINLSAYGVFEGDLIIGLELPSEPVGVPVGATSVNYSGPSYNVASGVPDWTLSLETSSEAP